MGGFSACKLHKCYAFYVNVELNLHNILKTRYLSFSSSDANMIIIDII